MDNKKFTEEDFDKAWNECFPKGYADVPGYFNDGKGFVVFYPQEIWEEIEKEMRNSLQG